MFVIKKNLILKAELQIFFFLAALHGMWNLVPWPGIEPARPALQGRVLITLLLGKSPYESFLINQFSGQWHV